MDVAQSLSDLRQAVPERWLQGINRYGPGIVMAVLVIIGARQLAAITWSALSDPAAIDAAPVPQATVAGATAGPSTAARYSALTGWRPFGEPPDPGEAVTVTEVLDAPDTTLNVQLHGVHEVTDPETNRAAPERGAAMISSGRAEQQLYFVGDAITGGSGAKLHSVYYDRVLLDRGGRVETLRLPLEVAANAPRQPAPAGRPGDIAQPAAATGGSASLRDALSDNAAQLTEIIRPTPHMEGGQMIGFRLAPGRNRDAFNALGLEPGDVMTEVNGLVMNDPRAAAQVFSALSETSVASVTVVRDGAPQVLTIDLSTVESIMENSQ
jgi:general secretion pathway protein C